MSRIRHIPAMCAFVASLAFAQPRQVKARDLYYESDSAAGHRLGLRYALLKVDPTSRKTQAVDPDANFSRGDCFAVEFSPNRDGHLYVFNRATSGSLQPLLPSAAMPDETSVVKSGKTVRVPQEYCFQLSDPPGVETLVVAVTERQEDLKNLDQWRQQQLAGRDLVYEKADEPKSGTEQPHSVYVVRTTSGEPTRMVVEVKIRHE
jgi:hypothetical protein